eukprot:PLAT11886.1.p2 GENE.PLAT11886.1~~PLAT11886.1.p2  ORF type:complete len:677 (+),score=331.33 PLAT11886.1:185-2032(+)
MEDVTRVLTADDPNVPRNITKYSYRDRMYKPEPPGPSDHLAIHFSMDGCVLHRSSEEGRLQLAAEEAKREEEELAKKAARDAAAGDELGIAEGGKNQFNYNERASQTFNNPMRERGVETEPPPVAVFAHNTTQWEIYDSYMAQYELQKREELLLSSEEKKEDSDAPVRRDREEDIVHSAAMGKSLKIMERMVNQNAEDEIYQDFKFWEDQSDMFREGEGSLLPLWRFSTERSKRKQVTALCWHPHFPDLFAVGYGSYDFMKQGSGLIHCFSLKNTSHPEYTFTTETGVMCVDFHPQHHALLAAGCYDGSVMVFDVRNKVNKPIYVSTVKTGKHTDPVWQVYWQEEDLAKELNFFSISSDGLVANWIMSKNELKMETVMQLKLVTTKTDEPDEEMSLTGLAGGCCFDFNRTSEHLFVVGTEEGKLHKCSKAYSGQYLENYDGHHMATYAVRWNSFHPRVFASCSVDWTVKLWDHSSPSPLMTFDLGNAVGDVAWAPYSSTVFAAVTNDGKVHVYDLNENKHEPLCEQKVVRRAKLTHIAFNPRDPIILVADDRGGVNSLKLSPNLRRRAEVAEGSTAGDAEIEKMTKLLASVDSARPDRDGSDAAAAAALPAGSSA